MVDVSTRTAVPYLVHRGKKYPIEAWADFSKEALTQVAANVTEILVALRSDTHYPVRIDDEICVATEEEVRMEEMKLDKLRKKDEIQPRPLAPPTMKMLFRQGPPPQPHAIQGVCPRRQREG
jgi:hypothetical protein